LVCGLDTLPLCCLAAICLNRQYAGNGKLAGYWLTVSSDNLPFRSRLEAITAELYVVAGGQWSKPPPDSESLTEEREAELVRQCRQLQCAEPDEYRIWERLAVGILSTLPLGLLPEHAIHVLRTDHGLEISGNDYRRLARLLTDEVAYELQGFLHDDTLDVITDRLGANYGTALASVVSGEHVETVYARIRNEIWQGRHASCVWDWIDRHLPNATDSDVESLLLRQRGLSLAGRMTDDTYCAQVRQQEYLFCIDEVMKSVAFSLVSGGYRIVAMANLEIVLHTPDLMPEELRHVEQLIRVGQARLLGVFASECSFEVRHDW
jgi:hypothetical protein